MSSAFKSTTKRSSIGAGDGDATRSHRRSRSLSRFSPRAYETPPPRGKFVNTRRGAGFPEVSLDDLALQLFESADRWRAANTSTGLGNSSSNSSSSSQKRGRSASRHGVGGAGAAWSRSDGGRLVQDSVKTRRRSASVARYRNSDTESEVEASATTNKKSTSLGNDAIHTFHKPAALNQRKVPGRSMSRKDMPKMHDGYSSQSSALTDDEPRNRRFSSNGSERTIRTVYAQKAEHPIGEDINTGLYNAMRKELRNAVEDIRLGLEQAMVHSNLANSSEKFQPMSKAKFDQKLDFSDDILMDDELDPEISKIMNDFLLDSENDAVIEKPRRTRQRSKDKRMMSKELIREAEQYSEDFISNIEDTDLSSFEGERSDSACGSSTGGIKRNNYPVPCFDRTETFHTPPNSSSTPVDMDDIVLPWLKWETSNDTSPVSCNKTFEIGSSAFLSNTTQDENTTHDHNNHSITSSDCCSPIKISGQSPRLENSSKSSCKLTAKSCNAESSTKTPYFDMDDYMDIARMEELTVETWRQKSRISNGSLHLCSPMFL